MVHQSNLRAEELVSQLCELSRTHNQTTTAGTGSRGVKREPLPRPVVRLWLQEASKNLAHRSGHQLNDIAVVISFQHGHASGERVGAEHTCAHDHARVVRSQKRTLAQAAAWTGRYWALKPELAAKYGGGGGISGVPEEAGQEEPEALPLVGGRRGRGEDAGPPPPPHMERVCGATRSG